MAKKIPFIGFELTGDWLKAHRYFQNLPLAINRSVLSCQRELALKVYRLVRSHLRNQDIPGWDPLKKGTMQARVRKGFSEDDALLASKDYYFHIEMWREDKVYHVGVRKGKKHATSNLHIDQIASIHEAWSFTRGKPHRPLWSYTFNTKPPHGIGGILGVKRFYVETLVHKLLLRGYYVNIEKR